MTEAVEYPRGVVNRGTNKQGNPGTFLGTKTVDGVTYARYRAEKGTWVSASLKERDYGLLYGKSTGYGAYAGIVRSPDGTPLANPDRIVPGQEYLFPVSPDEGQAKRISTDNINAKPQTIPQMPTLSQGPGKGKKWEPSNLELTKLNILGVMPIFSFDKIKSAQRKAWYLSKLGAFENQLHESAKKHRVPEQLIAAVILNELADISGLDKLQEEAPGIGSYGIAQIEVKTAILHGLVPKDDNYLFAKSWSMEDAFIAGALSVPQIAIDAAAKEIRIQLYMMAFRKDRPWQMKFGFDPKGNTSNDPQAVYSYIHKIPTNDRPEALNVEVVMAMLVSAAYNSPGITEANEPEKYAAALHGRNAAAIAKDLYEMDLFRPGW
jgi:hypothetical protein